MWLDVDEFYLEDTHLLIPNMFKDPNLDQIFKFYYKNFN